MNGLSVAGVQTASRGVLACAAVTDEVLARVEALVASVDERTAKAADLPDCARRKALRVAAGLRREDVAGAIGGVTRTAVWHWENGVDPVPGPTRVAYAYLLERLAERFPEA